MKTHFNQKYFYKKGDVYGTYSFISYNKNNKKWLVRCTCGKEKSQKIGDILKAKKCRNYWLHSNLEGSKIGNITILKFAYKKKKLNFYYCLCDCGNKLIKSKVSMTNKSRCFNCSLNNRPKRVNKGIAAFRAYYRMYLTRTKREKIVFKINQSQFHFLTQQPCYYCGISRKNEMKIKGAESYFFVGIDRVDNAKGYVIDNVVPCCHGCNRNKGSVSYEMAKKIIINKFKLVKSDISFLKNIQKTIRYKIEYSSKYRGFPFLLSVKRMLYIMNNQCYFCNNKDFKKFHGKLYPLCGIDRLDNSKGYTNTNSVSCCGKCNVLKKNISIDQCVKMIKFQQDNPYYVKLKDLSNKTKCLEVLKKY